MKISFLDWKKEVKKALVDKEMNLQEASEKAGYCYTTVSALVGGRVAKDNYQEVAMQINAVLGIEGIPEKPPTPSAKWCGAVRAAMAAGKYKMSIGQLSKSIGFNRDRISLVINGYSMDEPVVKAINNALEIKEPVLSSEADSIITNKEAE